MNNNIELIQTDDFFARYLFANESNKDLLLDFINAVRLDSGDKPFESIELKSTFNLKENIAERETIVDVRAKTNSNEEVIVEIQSAGNIKYIPRILFYIAVSYFKQLNIDIEALDLKKPNKIKYDLLNPVISINILNFDLLQKDEDMHSLIRLCNVETGQQFSNHWDIHLIELKKALNVKSHDLLSWVKFFTSKDLEAERIMITKEKPILEKAFDCYDRFKGDEQLMSAYREGQAYMASQIDMLRQERIEGREEGEAIGQQKEKIEIARNMLSENMTTELIIKMTGLTVEQIEKIKSDI